MIFLKLTEGIAMTIPSKSHLNLCPSTERKAVSRITEEELWQKEPGRSGRERLAEWQHAQADLFRICLIISEIAHHSIGTMQTQLSNDTLWAR